MEDEKELTDEQFAEILDNRPEFVEVRSDNCVCSDKSFESYGCTCQKRVQPG